MRHLHGLVFHPDLRPELGLQLLCQAKKGMGAGCSGSANYYKQMGQFHTKNPKPGDQIFFTNDSGKTMYHTGIVEKVAGGRVYTIEGNTSSAAGVVENGGCVRTRDPLTYSKIGGYGRPDFSIVPEEDKFNMDQPPSSTRCSKYYDSPFSAQDHHRLREVLSQVKGRFILSYNDHPLIRELYADYRIEGITRTTTLAGKGNNQTQYAELIIRNF